MKQNEIKDGNVSKITPQNFENLFNIYQNEDEQYFYNILKTVNFPDDLDPTLYQDYVTKPGDTWPYIAWKFYRNVKLWWVICSLNNIVNPVAQPNNGTKIKILNSNIVRDVLSEIREV